MPPNSNNSKKDDGSYYGDDTGDESASQNDSDKAVGHQHQNIFEDFTGVSGASSVVDTLTTTWDSNKGPREYYRYNFRFNY